MQIEKVMRYLDQNICDDDRKVYNKLLVHIKKRHTRTLNQLINTYNIDKKKFMFATATNLNDKYINKLESLIDMCRHIIEKKINISDFNAEVFHVGKCLDISTIHKIDGILNHLYSYNRYYSDISVSKELLKNPLLILTITTRKRLDLGLLEKHAYDFANNHALIEDKVQPVHSDLSAVNTFKKNYILDKDSNAGVQQVIIKEAIIDYFKTNGELYYISADDEEKVSRDVNALIESKSHFDGSTSNLFYKLFELIFPIANVAITSLLFLFSSIAWLMSSNTHQVTLNVLIYILLGYSAFNLGLYIYRVKVLSEQKNSFCYNYYLKYPRRLKKYRVMSLTAIAVQLVYLLVFNNFFEVIKQLDVLMSTLYQNKAAVSILTGVIISLGFFAMLIANKFFTHQMPKICFVISLIYGSFVLFIRTNFLNFTAFKGASIFFSTMAITILLYLILEQKKKVKCSIVLAILLLDVLLMCILNNEFYLRIFY